MKAIHALATVALALAASFAHALDIKPYSAEALAAAEQAGRPIAVHFRADWCPTCRVQDKALLGLKDEKDLDITVLSANYDTETDLKRRFNVRMQSTMVVLKGREEAARVVGEKSAEGLRKALRSAL